MGSDRATRILANPATLVRFCNTGRSTTFNSRSMMDANMYHWLLVVAQFVLAGALVLSSRWSPIPVVAILAALPGIGLAIWAWLRIGVRKIRIHPSATDETELITDGPYGIVRHPMYTGLLWFTAALLVEPWSPWRLVGWGMLLAVLYAKSLCEEQSMLTLLPDYESYQTRVGRLLPNWTARR